MPAAHNAEANETAMPHGHINLGPVIFNNAAAAGSRRNPWPSHQRRSCDRARGDFCRQNIWGLKFFCMSLIGRPIRPCSGFGLLVKDFITVRQQSLKSASDSDSDEVGTDDYASDPGGSTPGKPEAAGM